ncbi:hypothetical protein M011DRAFT_458833 [Sporormia fimetaria CBS 119925]|uniref:Uncharacterized protein n=1 Tax=Sporormia fimetaria CBS 119925 TaxID=1340428 RepID=A0A6A6VDK3_9PLEO|nr:hypothetical protein M011DRAFT_458833 [Sporormia fimetaria CBS 119925]
MVARRDFNDDHEVVDLQHSLRTTVLELNLAQSKHAVEIVAKEEELRRLRLDQLLLQDEVDGLHEQLEEEQTRAEGLEEALHEVTCSLEDYKANAEKSEGKLRSQAREIANLKAELKAMEDATADSNKILSEKLALTREMSSLRPEVEHLRAQVEANQGLLAEKLSLQRELSSLQVELDNEKKASARALAKQGKKTEQDDEIRTEIEEVRKALAKEKKERAKLENTLAKTEERLEQAQAELEVQQKETETLQTKLDKTSKKEDKAGKRGQMQNAEQAALREELEQERAAREEAEEMAKDGQEHQAEVERLRKELEQERRERKKAEAVAKKGGKQGDAQAEQLRDELDQERRERKLAEKEHQKAVAEMQGRLTVLDDKLSAFRDKLRTTKEKLKTTEAELEQLQSSYTTVRPSIETSKMVKNPRKRLAMIDPDSTNLGTPGDGLPAKRARLAKRNPSVSAIAETSNFSLTPFLNRQSSVAVGTPIAEEEEDEEDAGAGMEAVDSPSVAPKKPLQKVPRPKAKALAPSASNKANAKPIRKKADATPLEMVTEEEDSASQKAGTENAPVKVRLKDADDGTSKPGRPKLKPRKSLMSFTTFTEEPVAEKKKKKKERIPGIASESFRSKTLFDADDDMPVRPMSGKSLLAARALGKISKGSGVPLGGRFGKMGSENFTFSPLKKDRKNMSFLQ